MKKAFKSPKELAEKIDGYFIQCEQSKSTRELKSGDIRVRQQIPSMVGLAVYLGVGKSTLYDYAEGKYDKRISDSDIDSSSDGEYSRNSEYTEYIDTYSEVIARARDRIELATLDAASSGDMDGRVALSRLAKYGYSTRVESESKATLTVQWEGVSTDDVREWGR